MSQPKPSAEERVREIQQQAADDYAAAQEWLNPTPVREETDD